MTSRQRGPWVVACIVILTPALNLGGAAEPYAAPRTAWGDPDLQGHWTMATFTPLERPERFAGREFLTEPPRQASNTLYRQ